MNFVGAHFRSVSPRSAPRGCTALPPPSPPLLPPFFGFERKMRAKGLTSLSGKGIDCAFFKVHQRCQSSVVVTALRIHNFPQHTWFKILHKTPDLTNQVKNTFIISSPNSDIWQPCSLPHSPLSRGQQHRNILLIGGLKCQYFFCHSAE